MADPNFLRLASISAMIAEGLPRQEIFHRIVESVGLLGFDRVCLEMLSEDGFFLQPVARHGFLANGLGLPIPAAEDSDLRQLRVDPRPQIFLAGSVNAEEPAYKRGCVPVLLKGNVVGKVWVENSARTTLDKKGLQKVLPFAQQAALVQAICQGSDGSLAVGDRNEEIDVKPSDVAKLSAESLETLRKMTLAITSMRSRDELLKAIVEQSVKLLRAKSGGLYEYRPERADLKLLAEYNRPENIGEILKHGEGMAGRLVSTEQPHMMIENYHRWEGQAEIYKGKEIFGAVLAVPLRWERRQIGVLYVDDKAGREFSEDEILLLRLFGDQVAISLANSSLVAQDEQKLKRLERLANATQQMVGDLGSIALRDRLSMIARHAAEILDAETAGVFLARDGRLVLEASFGHREEFTPEKVPPLEIHDKSGAGLTGYIAYHGKLFKDHGPSLKRHFAVAQSSPHTPSRVCYSLLAIPLHKLVDNRRKLIGLIRVDNKRGGEDRSLAAMGFSQEDEWILTIFAEAAIVAIESAKLVDRLTEQVAFSERLVSSSPDGIIAVDRQGRVTEFNSRAEEVLLYKKAEVVGRPVAPLYLNPREPRLIGKLLHENPDHHVRDYETFIQSSSGEAIPIRHASTWLLDSNGERIGSVGYFEDLRSQKALERREAKLLDQVQRAKRAAEAVARVTLFENREATLESIVRETQEALGCGAVVLFEYNGKTGNLMHPPAMAGVSKRAEAVKEEEKIDYSIVYFILGLDGPYIVEDVSMDGNFKSKRFTRVEGIRSCVAMPLKASDRKVGVMFVNYRDRRRFTQDDLANIELFANQAAVAIRNAQLFEEAAVKLRQEETLAELSKLLLAAKSVQDAMTHSVSLAAGALNTELCNIVLPDREGRLIFSASHGWPQHLVGNLILEPGKGSQTGYTVQQGKPVMVDDYSKVTEFRVPEVVSEVGLRSGLSVPMFGAEEEIVGAMLVHTRYPRRFTEQDEVLLSLIANQTAVALEKAKLFAEVQRVREAAEVVARVTLLEETSRILVSIASEIRSALDCGFVALYKYDQEAGALVLPPAVAGAHKFADKADEEVISSFVRSMIERNELYMASDVMADEQFSKMSFFVSEGMRSCVAIPLMASTSKVGIIFISYKSPRRFTYDELANMELYANQAAVAIRNAQLLDVSAAKLAQQEALAGLSRELLGAKTVQEAMDRAVEYAARALGIGFCCIVLPDRAEQLIISSAYGWESSLIGNLKLKPGIGSQTGYTIDQRRPVAVYDYSKADFEVPETVAAHGIRSGLSVPMFRAEEVIGAMLVHSIKPRRFTRDDEVLLSLIANQTAIALERVQQYEANLRKSVHLAALYETSKVITTQFGPERRQILDQILQVAVTGIFEVQVKHVCGAIELYNEEEDDLVIESIYPPDLRADLVRRVGERRQLKVPGAVIGITGKTILTGETQKIDDVRGRTDYLEYFSGTRSEVAVPLVDRDRAKVIGVLNAESDRVYAFDSEDQKALGTLAELVVVALQNVRQAEELREAVEAQTALAWMGLGNANLRHDMPGEIGLITLALESLREALKDLGVVDFSTIYMPLVELERRARKIAERLEKFSRAGEDDIYSVRVNRFIRGRKDRLKDTRLEDVPLEIRTDLADDATVRANSYWLDRVLDILLRNAARATEDQMDREITLGTRASGDKVEIYVEDNGIGIDDSVRQRIFKGRVRAPGSKGLGMGLLQAYSMVKMYDGTIQCKNRSPRGTSMIISLPLEVREAHGQDSRAVRRQ